MNKLNDKQLFVLCQKYGRETLDAKRKFTGLLPEVLKRRLYEKKGFSSIYEFAARLAGISKEHVQRVICLERRFEEMPILKKALANGEISVNKLSRIASIATVQNQEELAASASVMPNRTLETFVKEIKIDGEDGVVAEQDGLFKEISKDGEQNECDHRENSTDKSDHEKKDVHVHVSTSEKSLNNAEIAMTRNMPARDLIELFAEFALSRDTLARLSELKKKGFELNSLLNELLDAREEKIEQEMELLAGKSIKTQKQASKNSRVTKNNDVKIKKNDPSRYIPTRIKQLLNKQYGEKCAIPHCSKKSKILHHTIRYAMGKTHNPYYLAPLCEEHHNLAHMTDVQFVKAKLKCNA